jgi:hypothetical protein
MKKNAIWTLVKDVILIVILGGITSVMCKVDGTLSPQMETLLCVAVAGIPFGWRWASKIITAVSLQGIGLKLLISVCLGCIAIFVVVFGDIVRFVSYICRKLRRQKQMAYRT